MSDNANIVREYDDRVVVQSYPLSVADEYLSIEDIESINKYGFIIENYPLTEVYRVSFTLPHAFDRGYLYQVPGKKFVSKSPNFGGCRSFTSTQAAKEAIALFREQHLREGVIVDHILNSEEE